MEQAKEAVYLINDNKYLHLREMTWVSALPPTNVLPASRWKADRSLK